MKTDDNTDNADEDHKLVDLVEANDESLDDGSNEGNVRHLFFQGNRTSFDKDSDPDSNTYDGNDSKVSITSISAPASFMTATVSSSQEDGDNNTECSSERDGNLLDEQTYKDSSCGDRDDSYIINNGDIITWDGEEVLTGTITIKSGGTLKINTDGNSNNDSNNNNDDATIDAVVDGIIRLEGEHSRSKKEM